MSKLEMSPEMLRALERLTTLLVTDDALDKTFDCIVELSTAVVPGCDAAGITLCTDAGFRTTSATGDFALAIDQIQYDEGEGPCLEALASKTIQRIEAVSVESRWPAFTPRASEIGFGSNVSFPLDVNGTVGALNVYSKQERVFDEGALEIGKVFVRQARIALNNAHTYVAARRLSDQLNEALKSRDLIGQAKGIIMEREGVTDAEAFEMLRTISQHTNVKLRLVAEQVIAERVAATSSLSAVERSVATEGAS